MPGRKMPAPPGFTLLELLIVIAIAGLALTIAVGHGPAHTARLEMRAGAAQFADALRRAQAQALADSHDVHVVIDPDHRRFATDGDKPHGFAANVTVNLLPGTIKLPHDMAEIVFSADGSASGGGLSFVSSQSRYDVEVEWLSGSVQVTRG